MPRFWTSPSQKRWIAILFILTLGFISLVALDLWHTLTPLPILEDLESTPSAPNTSASILVVSAFFPLKRSKHSLSEYRAWMAQFLQLETPIYLFLAPTFTDVLPNPLPHHITVNTSLSSPFEATPLVGRRDVYERMWTKDREHDRHNPELYAVWNAKPWLVDQAAKNVGREYEYYFWSDSGAFRGEHHYLRWPAPERVHQVWQEAGGKDRIFFPVFQTPNAKYKSWKEEHGPIDQDISEGSFFGGTASAVSWYSEAFYAYHDYYIALEYFAGKDQSIINALFLLFPSRFHGVFYDDPHSPAYIAPSSPFDHRWWRQLAHDTVSAYAATRALGKCGAEWYYYQFFLASKDEREKMRLHWIQTTAQDRLDWWLKATGDPRCRLTVPVRMEDVLKRKDVFGKGWIPPARHVRLSA